MSRIGITNYGVTDAIVKSLISWAFSQFLNFVSSTKTDWVMASQSESDINGTTTAMYDVDWWLLPCFLHGQTCYAINDVDWWHTLTWWHAAAINRGRCALMRGRCHGQLRWRPYRIPQKSLHYYCHSVRFQLILTICVCRDYSLQYVGRQYRLWLFTTICRKKSTPCDLWICHNFKDIYIEN